MPKLYDHRGRVISTTEVPFERRQKIYRRLRASYDAAKDSHHLQNHWSNADSLSPSAANSLAVRKKLRSRSRYEVIENNPYLKGMILTLANDFTGTGPKFQVTDGRLTKEQRRFVERRWQRWARRIKLRQILWRMLVAKKVDGEPFLVNFTNRKLKDPVKLDYKVIETDQVTDPMSSNLSRKDELQVDGIRFDPNGIPTAYHILRHHPGESLFYGFAFDGDWVPADHVIHWFRQDRGWQRGIPETTPSLPLCALLRRYVIAVVLAAETAADFSAVLESEAPPSNDNWGGEDDPFDQIPIEKGLMVNLPWGQKLHQLRAEQPTAVVDKFVDLLMREIARPLLMPFNMAVGFSGGYNMASGTLDRQLYQGGINSERYDCEEDVLDPIAEEWWFEASRIPDHLPTGIRNATEQMVPDHVWRWDQVPEHTDPLKVANALNVQWQSGFITDADIQEQRFNRDVDDFYDELAEQNKRRKEIGAPLPGPILPIDEPEEEDADFK